ncbi:MAG: hypothetical protein IPH12_13630 [Saprospirales bacterium]|nr:hypothetical protein [Saprospirales bacterium]
MTYTFADFAGKFPPVPMPATLGEATHHVFSTENEPLPDAMILQFILPNEPDTAAGDPYTEYVPCFTIDDTDHFIALVWWKAELMNYEYVLATYTGNGALIDRKVIAYTRIRGDKIQRAVATINEDWEIFIAAGDAGTDDAFDPTSSHTYDLEIMADGMIQ